jgi:uncharacterized membrane protein YkvA (DUF1232 family)
MYCHILQKEFKMADKKPGKLLVPPQGGIMRDFVKRLKLITRLMGDRRVSMFVKLLPLASLAYLIWPADAIPAIPLISGLDDAAILWIGSTLFVELCPPNVVKEHQGELDSNLEEDDGEIVDAESTDVNDK